MHTVTLDVCVCMSHLSVEPCDVRNETSQLINLALNPDVT